MPWCPKCKMEYQEGFTECSDCKTELVYSLEKAQELIPLLQSQDIALLEKLVSYFEYSGLKANIELNQTLEVYEVKVPEKKYKQAKKLFQAFNYVESERKLKEQTDSDEFTAETIDTEDTLDDNNAFETEDSLDADNAIETEDISDAMNTIDSEDAYDIYEDEEAQEDTIANKVSNVYVMKEDQYKDLRDTVLVFLLFGIAGVIVVVLNVVGIFLFMSAVMMQAVFAGISLFFLYVAISTHKKAAKVKSEIDAENQLTNEINAWLKQNVTDRFLTELHDENLSDEINYIKKINHIKELLIKEFGKENPAYLDRLIDEFYNDNFDQ